MPIMLSPGVKTRELDFSMYASALSSCVVGMVGGANKGPIGVPTFCSNQADFLRIFGNPVDDDFGPISALLYLAKGSALWYVREDDATSAKASISFDGTGVGTAQVETATVAVTSVTAGDIVVTVTAAGLTGSPKAVTVAVAESDTAAAVAGKVRVALGNDSAITNLFTVGGATIYASLTRKVAVANDATLNIAIAAANGVTAALTSGHTTAGSLGSAITEILTIEYKENGDYSHKYSFKIIGAVGLSFTLVCYEGNIIKESFLASMDSTSPKYIGTKYSDEFTYTVDIKTATGISNSDKTALAGGTNGLPLAVENVIGEGTRGLQSFANPNSIDISVLVAPGRSEATVIAALLGICENRSDCFAIIDPPIGLEVTQAVAFHNGTGGETNDPEAALNNSYGAMYYPWVKVTNPVTAATLWAPPSAVITGVYANNDNLSSPWFAPAGLTRGKLTQVLDVERDLSEGDMDQLYGNDNAINPIINFRKQGVVVWGQRTLQREDTALDRVNVRRMMLYVRKIIATSSAYVVFEQNDQGTWTRWTNMVVPFLESVKNGRGLYEYQVVMDSTTVTPAHIDRNEMPGKILLRPTKTAEFVSIDFVLKSTGASFSS